MAKTLTGSSRQSVNWRYQSTGPVNSVASESASISLDFAFGESGGRMYRAQLEVSQASPVVIDVNNLTDILGDNIRMNFVRCLLVKNLDAVQRIRVGVDTVSNDGYDGGIWSADSFTRVGPHGAFMVSSNAADVSDAWEHQDGSEITITTESETPVSFQICIVGVGVEI